MIDILLASYNGEKYIAEQIDSILSQTYEDWVLYIKDDCSTDNTVKIIKDYEKRYKDKIKVIISDKPSGSAKNNFFSMFEYSNSDYIMTCDQDDVWLPDKVKITLERMKEAEEKNTNIPILVHTDLKVVDENLNTISESLFKMQNLDCKRDKLNNLLVQNIVTGCTIMVNKKLKNHINPIPKYAVIHDWWIALLASCFGQIIFVNVPTVLYRQHRGNVIGAKDVCSIKYLASRLLNLYDIKKAMNDSYIQAEEILKLKGMLLFNENYNIIYQYTLLQRSNLIRKIKLIKKYEFWKNSFIRILGQILF